MYVYKYNLDINIYTNEHIYIMLYIKSDNVMLQSCMGTIGVF
jgi:hypothetical protein